MLPSDDKHRPSVTLRVGSVVYGDRAREWEHWMLKSVKRVHPNIGYLWIAPDPQEMSFAFGNLADRAMNDYSKAELWGCFQHSEDPGPVWVLDADTILLRPLRWNPASSEVIMAAAPGGDAKYLEFLRKAEMQIAHDTVINSGVLWLNADLRKLWRSFFSILAPIVSPTPYPLGECVWNAIWQYLHLQGKVELLPQEYNQIISEHGPYQGTIFHLAGAPEHFKARLMESYFRYFTGEQT